MAKTVKEALAGVTEPWKGIMTKENYDKYTKGMPKAEKEDFDLGLVTHDTNCLMSLGALGLYEPMKRRTGARGKKNGTKK